MYDFPFSDTALFVTGKTFLLSGCFAVLETIFEGSKTKRPPR